MNTKRFCLLAMTGALLANGSAFAAGTQGASPALGKLDVSAGRWVYQGQTMKARSGRGGPWTWHEECRWSEDRMFMVCNFDNIWAGAPVHSVVVDTYDARGKSYWHYEIFNDGDSGARPFTAKMTINGNVRTEYAESVDHGRKTDTRITYVFESPSHVDVKIETKDDGGRWATVAQGTGVKQP